MNESTVHYQIIVVGAGHAGCEAALAAARLGASTLLVTISPDTIAAMSCNPAIGGPAAKSHLVREIDALGGEMGKVIDRTYLNIRRINESRGPAVAALRAQADKKLYQAEMTLRIERQPNLFLKQGIVTELLAKDGQVSGIRLKSGREYYAEAVVLCTGTFLNGTIVMGEVKYPGGRQGEPAVPELSASLAGHGLKLRRFQTATPPRIDGRTVVFDQMTVQPLQKIECGFSWDGLAGPKQQHPCWMTTTTPETIAVIQQNLYLSPIRSGAVASKGPHFCPSIDRKVINFPQKTDHQIFLEPEGVYTEELYLLGLTTAMPEAVQEQILATIPGLEEARVIRPGYAVEYDCLDSFQFWPSLESKRLRNLFTAGQLNGTSGYEEAAGQGIIAGINAVRKIRGLKPYIPRRTASYLGVLIDDLAIKGTEEPYRMMTSLAEFRLFLRLDNALARLGEDGRGLGLLPAERLARMTQLQQRAQEFRSYLEETKVAADSDFWDRAGLEKPARSYRLRELILHPLIPDERLLAEFPDLLRFEESVRELVWNELKLDGYLKRQQAMYDEANHLEAILIPFDFNYEELKWLSRDGRAWLETIRPLTLGQALRVSHLSESDRAVLILRFGPNGRNDRRES